jgi:hypothetical protein
MRFVMTSGEATEVAIAELIVAGWAGRDPAAIAEHIEELQALGVKPPSRTPLFYRLAADRLTTAQTIQVLGETTSGEAEVLLVGTGTGTCVGIGSDHTDRDAEAWSVVHSKQLCPKPVAPVLWPLSEVLAHWDRLRLEADAVIDGERVRYQAGTVDGLLSPETLFHRFGLDEIALKPGQAMLCGTLPTIGGVRPAQRFEMALVDPVLGRRIEQAYDIHTLPIVS